MIRVMNKMSIFLIYKNFHKLFRKFFFFRNEKLLQGVYGMGFNKPSKIQETALPMLLADP